MLSTVYRTTLDAAPIDAGTPRIVPNRLQIDDRFPCLAFMVDTAGNPFYEVVLTTERSQFDAANAARRTSESFYSSRQDSGLIRSDGPISAYVVPSSTLRNFAKAREIYFTVIAYRGQDGSGASFALDPRRLATDAPSVSIAPGFTGHTLAAVLSVPLERLCRVRDDGSSGNGHHSLGVLEPEMDAETDRAEGEDGYGITASDALESAHDTGDEGHLGANDSAAFDAGIHDTADDPYDDGFGPIHETAGSQVAGLADVSDPGAESYEASVREDLYQESVEAPAMLEDQDYEEQEYQEPDDVEPGAAASGYADTDYRDGMESNGPGVSESIPYETLDYPTPAVAPAPARPLTIEARRQIIGHIAPFESGADGYAAINADGEFEGRFPGHPAHGRYHIGLSYGIVQFTQDSGSLGRLLALMRERDATKFLEVFGPRSEDLVRITNQAGPSSRRTSGGRSVRVQPVDGADLWTQRWTTRFREAARTDLFGAGRQLFNGAQNELASSLYLDPILPFAKSLGLTTERGLAMVLDRSVQMGPAGARRWVIDVVGPVQTAAQRQQALAALGHSSLRSFQSATSGLRADGDWGPSTHAGMVAALRAIGDRSPLPIPGPAEMLQAMVRRAAGRPWERRTKILFDSLPDIPFEI